MKGAWVLAALLVCLPCYSRAAPHQIPPVSSKTESGHKGAQESSAVQTIPKNLAVRGTWPYASARRPKSAVGQYYRAHEPQDTDSKASYWANPLTWFTLGLLGVGVLQWLTYRRQNIIYRDQSRAFVSIDGFNTLLYTQADTEGGGKVEIGHGATFEKDLIPTFFSIQPRWRNSGGTPTRNLITQVGWRPLEEKLPSDFDFGMNTAPERHFLAPHSVETSSPIEIGPGPVQREIAYRSMLHGFFGPKFEGRPPECPYILVWGRADYEDVFGELHFSEWCYRVQFSRTPGERLSASGFAQYGPYNRTDHDEQTPTQKGWCGLREKIGEIATRIDRWRWRRCS